MNKIDCKIVLEEYVLLHQAYENQEFKRLLPILEQHTCVHTHDAELRRQALLDQAKGGVLFIDEAYELGRGAYGRNRDTLSLERKKID